MSVMTAPEPGVWHGQDRVLTVDDMASMPDDEFRYELDDGVLIVSPAPSQQHQLAVMRLAFLLEAVRPAGLEILAGVGVNITKFQHRVPDLAVVRTDTLGTMFQEFAPELVVEVASPRTRLYDRNRKKDIYESCGIPAYWIVDPDLRRPRLTVFELRDGKYVQAAVVSGDEAFAAQIPFPVTIIPRALVSPSVKPPAGS